MTSQFKWECDEPTRIEAAQARIAEREKATRDVYRWVNQRDGYHCRFCGVRTDPQALALANRGHHHHIVFRSAGGGTVTANVVLLCASCHNDVHRHRLNVDGNADLALTFWRREGAGDWFVIRRELAVGVTEKD